jgi:hypothetical protein
MKSFTRCTSLLVWSDCIDDVGLLGSGDSAAVGAIGDAFVGDAFAGGAFAGCRPTCSVLRLLALESPGGVLTGDAMLPFCMRVRLS